MNRLVTFGCSNTFGVDLDDNYHTKEFPSKYAWPNHLADLLKVPVVNNSKIGIDNKEILFNILNYDFDENDVVFVLWSYHDRHCIIKNDSIEMIGIWRKKHKLSKWYYKYLWNKYDSTFENYLYINLAHYHLQEQNIEHIFLSCSQNHIDLSLEWNSVKFLNVFFDDVKTEFPLAKDGLHPGMDAHKVFAKIIYDKYYKKTDFYNGSKNGL